VKTKSNRDLSPILSVFSSRCWVTGLLQVVFCAATVTAHSASAEAVPLEARTSKARLEPDLIISTRVTDEMVEALDVPAGSIVELRSIGGRESAFLALGKKLYQLDVHVILNSVCVSACAEYFLAYPGQLTITANAFIAFHHNSVLLDRLSQDIPAATNRECFGAAAEKLRQYRSIRLPGNQILEAQLKSLGRYKITGSPDGPCSVELQYEHVWWVPSSIELSELFDVEIPPVICNDNVDCALGMLALISTSGNRVLLEDQTMIVP
jgi:hypothetical protein